MATPDPISNEPLFNSIVLAGKRSPGVVTISGHDREIDWDVKVGQGVDGATTTIKAIPPIKFTCTFSLLKDEGLGINQFEEWETFAKVIKATVKGATPKAVDIYHPDLASNDIKSVCYATIGGKVHDGKGGQTVAVKFQEYRQPKPAPKTAAGSKSKIDPNADVKRELAILTAQNRTTPFK